MGLLYLHHTKFSRPGDLTSGNSAAPFQSLIFIKLQLSETKNLRTHFLTLHLTMYLATGWALRLLKHMGEEINGGGRKLHNKELNNSLSLPNITRGVKCRKTIWARHNMNGGEKKCVHNFSQDT
jgi:hypothetical protein